MIFAKRITMAVLVIALLTCFCGGSDDTSPFTASGTVYLDGQPTASQVEFGVKSAGLYADSPWTSVVKSTASDGTFSFTTTDYNYEVRLKAKNPDTGEWQPGFTAYDSNNGKSKSGGKWVLNFQFTSQ